MARRAALGRVFRRWSLELLAVGFAALVVAVLRWRGTRMGWPALAFMLPAMVAALPKILGWGVALNALGVLARRGSLASYLRGFLRPSSLVSWARLCACFMLVTFGYAWLKVSIPLLRTELYDLELWQLDRRLHLGFAPNIFFVELLRAPALLQALDLWYSFWVVTVFAAWAWAAARPELAQRRHFAIGSAVLSIAGVWLYLALPALGPCYAFPELFAGVADRLPHAVATQRALAENYARMLLGREGQLRQFNPYLGVAAFPSLHVAAHWYFALWARRFEPRLFVPLAAATLLTFVGSLATGWHYAVDGYAGLLLAWGAVLLADRLAPAPARGTDAAAGEP